ncbi:glyoxalase/bleomycin resistance/extradiol dioxygenase family protein [Paucilactobacillus suebicus]|uniref:PhnB-like domain-containing protein n=1 Tax=Paucilactobacillus suebicus DSM 5007 = KCTC 3549 TaxID=1423807 RepID=A0A0R1W3T6_9LACO|nr:glyoxalase/bleomycin resistance/extradiol dioxygenase family protein [Paucilactobacillus suebicus]KRM12159.1 hypothetical protein FD16_GL000234 [Paucilactobacillus suebicus DSM 5007 = KCTC 3549]
MTAKLYPYITFINAKEAMAYYKEVFGATNISRLPVSEDQAEYYGMMPSNLEDTTYHGEFEVAGTKILCSDAFMAEPQPSSLISILLDFDSNDTDDTKIAEDLFNKVTESDTVRVILPYSPQANGDRMGQFVDHYGITWVIRVGERIE